MPSTGGQSSRLSSFFSLPGPRSSGRGTTTATVVVGEAVVVVTTVVVVVVVGLDGHRADRTRPLGDLTRAATARRPAAA